ncbi:MAG: single-stranded DNA-binding protein [Coprobacillaceae bacterium]
MFNEGVLLGRLVNEPILKETNGGTKLATAVLEIEKGFKNGVGVVESDYVSVVLWRGIAEALIDCSKKGSIIGVKGRLQSRTYETSDLQRITTMEVVAEKVNFFDKYIKKN